MMKTGMMRTRIDKIRHPHLGDSAQSLEVWMGYDIKDPLIRYSNKTVNWIVKYFEFCCRSQTEIIYNNSKYTYMEPKQGTYRTKADFFNKSKAIALNT